MMIDERLNKFNSVQFAALLKELKIDNGDKLSGPRSQLVAYYVPSDTIIAATGECELVDGIEDGELKRFCAERLPNHMRPSKFIAINDFPRLPNQKIDVSD